MEYKKGYSFSTSWNTKRHTNGREMINEIKELGFGQVELNYNVPEEMLKSITPMIDKGEIKVSSVHNVFPFYEDKDYGTDTPMLGFDDVEKRKKAVDLLINSIEYADRLGAKGVVVHPGEVPFSYNIDTELKNIWREKGKDSKEYQSLWNEMLHRRNELAPIYTKRIQDSLEEAADFIVKKNINVKIGIETRARCYQIPTLKEADQIIDNLKGSPVYLWYDVGHGMIMESMGLYDNVNEVQQMKDKILGVHIHETIDLVDHYCPYIHSGDNVTFDSFLEVIDAAPLKVYELKGNCSEQQIEDSYQLMTKKIQALKIN